LRGGGLIDHDEMYFDDIYNHHHHHHLDGFGK
jgi:hypothetical protein